jgi:AbrB family looped-hinge helix DNA binding protein
MGFNWYRHPMKATIDSGGRLLIPKSYRDQLGFAPGSVVDISPYGGGLQITPGGRSGRLVQEGEHLVIDGRGVLTDEVMYALIDAGRR